MDDLLIPLRIAPDGFEATAFAASLSLQLRPPSTEGGFQVRDWRFGAGTIMATPEGELAHLVQPFDAGATDGEVAEPAGAERVDAVDVRVPFDAQVAVLRSAGEEHAWHALAVDGIVAERWVQVGDVPLYVALDGEGRLAQLRVAAPVRRARARRITLRAEHGWEANASTWFGPDGTQQRGVALHRSHPPMSFEDGGTWTGPAPELEHSHEPGVDGTGGLLTTGDQLESLDGMATDGRVDLPVAEAELDELEVELAWPTAAFRVTIDADAARARFEFGATPDRWLEVGGMLLVGVAAGGELAAIVMPRVAIHDEAMHGFDDPMGMQGMSQAEMFAQATQQMREQFALEQDAARRFVRERPFAAYGLAEPPAGPCALRIVDGPFGPEQAIGVQLEHGDMLARMRPEGDRDAPLVIVSHVRVIEELYPPGMLHDEQLMWLDSERMLRKQWAIEAGEAEPPDIADMQFLAMGPDEHERRIRALAERAEPATLVVDGEALDASLVREGDAFVVRAERDGWRIALQASGMGNAIPELVTVDELDAFVEGRAAADQRMLDWHDEMAQQMQAMPDAPREAATAKQEAERLMHSLQGGMHMPMPGPVTIEPADLFTGDVLAAWGGADAMRRPLDLVLRAAHVSGSTDLVARDGSVAHGRLHVHLPRPDGMGVGFSIGIDASWWDHDAAEIRELAARQPEREQQGEYELAFHVLLERQGDSSMRIATDVLRLLDEHLGGLERLLEPAR